ncbi:MAG: hypothetical protein JWQ40_3302 [Segetibacter sp.]|nr:hypothetical protein [Segetibacter sp.]
MFAAVTAGTLGSCKKVISKLFTGFDAQIPEFVVNIPYYPLPPGTPVPASAIETNTTESFNLDSIIKANTAGAFGAGDVNSVKIKRIVLTILEPDQNNNLSNFESLNMSISSNSNSTRVPLASFIFQDVYTPTRTYEPGSEAPELKSYLAGTQLTYHSSTKIRRYTTKPLKLSIKVTITAK